jgi:hypothetical protein
MATKNSSKIYFKNEYNNYSLGLNLDIPPTESKAKNSSLTVFFN